MARSREINEGTLGSWVCQRKADDPTFGSPEAASLLLRCNYMVEGTMTRPRNWHRYTTWIETKKYPIDTGLARFAARYRIATSLTALEFDGLGQAATAGYTSALRAALAYSALEAFDQAKYGKPGRTQVRSAHVARSFAGAGAVKLQALLAAELTNNKLRTSVAEISANRSGADVSSLAAGVRHLVFHGDFTAYGSGAAQSKSVRMLLDNLSEATLLAADDAFELYLDREAIGPWPVSVESECAGCGVGRGVSHNSSCAVARCQAHGEQFAQCSGSGRHSPGTNWGVFPGTIEAFKRGWIVKIRGSQHPDINRVQDELEWDANAEQYR